MKLTLSFGGGITGLKKVNSIDLNTLDDATRKKLLEYFRNTQSALPKNMVETWNLGDKKEVPIDNKKMDSKLKKLYMKMKKDLMYVPNKK